MEATYPPSDTTSIIANLAHKPNKTTADKHRILEHHQKKTGNPLPPRGTDPSSTPPVPAPFFPNPPLANPVFPPNPLFRPRPEYPPSLPESNLSDVASELLPASHRDVDPRMARPKMVKLAGQIQNTPEMRAKFEEFRRRREKESQTAPADGEPSLAPSQRGEETVQGTFPVPLSRFLAEGVFKRWMLGGLG